MQSFTVQLHYMYLFHICFSYRYLPSSLDEPVPNSCVSPVLVQSVGKLISMPASK